MLIAMKQITGRYGYPDVFILNARGDRLELYGINASPSRSWDSDSKFVFRFRQVSHES